MGNSGASHSPRANSAHDSSATPAASAAASAAAAPGCRRRPAASSSAQAAPTSASDQPSGTPRRPAPVSWLSISVACSSTPGNRRSPPSAAKGELNRSACACDSSTAESAERPTSTVLP